MNIGDVKTIRHILDELASKRELSEYPALVNQLNIWKE